MTFTAGNFLILAGLILVFSILLSKTGYKAGIPVLLVFLVVGMLFGEDGLGIHFSNYEIAQSIGMVAMSIILFNGGLDTKFESIKPVLGPGIVLATVGVLLTTVITGYFIYIVSTSFPDLFHMRVSFPVALLIAATMSSTDSASVFSIIRAQKMKMRNNLQPLLELESGSNDPMANILTIVLIQIVLKGSGGNFSTMEIILTFFWQFGMGLLIGFLFGRGYVFIHNKIKLENKSMYQILIMGFVFLAFSITDAINANGYLAVYIAGIVVGNAGMKSSPKIHFLKKKYSLFGNKKIIERRSIDKLLDGLTWLVQIVMFLMLGLLVTPHNMVGMASHAITLGFFVIFIGRPLAVFLSLLPFRNIDFKAKVFVSWVGLRGAAPIIFATYPVVYGVKDGDLMFNVVFFITLISLLVQGTTIPFVAKWLKLGEKDESGPENFGIEIPDELNTEMEEQTVEEELLLKNYPLNKGKLVMIVKRGERYIIPNGNLCLKKGDRLLIISESKEENFMESLEEQQYKFSKLNWNFNINILNDGNKKLS